MRRCLSGFLVVITACDGLGPRPHGADGGWPLPPPSDFDHDGRTVLEGDCNDRDPTIFPGAPELCDGKDHDCDGVADDTCDDDQDGFAAQAGGSRPGGDCGDYDPMVNPDAMEVTGDQVDNDCDGRIDELAPRCDGQTDATGFAGAMEICPPWLLGAEFNAGASPLGRAVAANFGHVFVPRAGTSFVFLSTGVAADENDLGFVVPQPGSQFFNKAPNPLPMPVANGCSSGADPLVVNDYLELKLTLRVPTNARSFSFEFMFASAEYPEFVGSVYNDKFLALLESKAFTGNVSFDARHQPITVNTGFFDVCQSARVCGGTLYNSCGRPLSWLGGTGYEEVDPWSGLPIGGSTGWLTTTSPVTPGETIELRFVIFDESDFIYDSSVLIDNFQWQLTPAAAPTTIG